MIPVMGRRRRSDVLTQAILASAPDAVVVLDDGGAVVEFNPAAERMFGVRRDAVIGAELHDGMLLPSSPAERAPLDHSYEATATRSDGATFPAEVSTAPVVGVDARLRVLYVRDISERRRAQRAVYDLAAIIESSEDAIVSQTLDGVIESWNAGAERLYGHTAAEAIGQRISLVEPLGRPDQSPAVLALIRRGRPIENLETVRVRKDGAEVHVSLTVSPIVDARGRVIGAAEIGRDITARKLAEQRVAYLAYHDDLTGLPNRLMFAEHLDLALARAQRHDHQVAVLYVDLDDFKQVNDTYGHEAGDQLLRQVARRLERATRATDLVARHGGDEFIVLVADLPPGPDPAAREIAHTIAAHVEQALAAPAVLDGATVTSGGSVGIAVYPEDATTSDALLRQADAAMYRSKELSQLAAGAGGGARRSGAPPAHGPHATRPRAGRVRAALPAHPAPRGHAHGGRGGPDPLAPPRRGAAGSVGVHPAGRAHRSHHGDLGLGHRRGVPGVAAVGRGPRGHPDGGQPAHRPLAARRRRAAARHHPGKRA